MDPLRDEHLLADDFEETDDDDTDQTDDVSISGERYLKKEFAWEIFSVIF